MDHAGWSMPESICAVVLSLLVPLDALVVGSCLPVMQAGQQQIILITQGIVQLPLLLAHLKDPAQLGLHILLPCGQHSS